MTTHQPQAQPAAPNAPDRPAEQPHREDPTTSPAERGAHSEAGIPLVEETARIDKHEVENGRVRVRTHTETVEEVLRETLRSDLVGVARVPIGRTIVQGEPVPQIREEDGLTIIPVFEEQLVVEKRLVLVEEVHIRHTLQGKPVELPVTLRRQHATVERVRAEEEHAAEGTQPGEPVMSHSGDER